MLSPDIASYTFMYDFLISFSMASTIGNMALRQAKSDALFGMLIADAIAMPVHWYYNPQDIHTGYNGWLTGYRAPNKKHPSSILSLSAVGMLLFFYFWNFLFLFLEIFVLGMLLLIFFALAIFFNSLLSVVVKTS